MTEEKYYLDSGRIQTNEGMKSNLHPYNIIDFLGYGSTGSVFVAKHNGNEVALKIHYGDQVQKGYVLDRCKKEFEKLKRLEGIVGIPSAIELVANLQGNYEELGLGSSGKSIEEIVPTNRINFNQYGAYPYFSGAFSLELVRDAKCLFKTKKISSEFFDKLEAIVKEVHERGFAVPVDITILVQNHNPYLIDWTRAIELNNSPYGKQTQVQMDMSWIESIRKAREI